MKKYIFLSVLIALVAVSLSAQIGTKFPVGHYRNAYVRTYTSCAQAVAPPSVIATGDDEIPCFQVIIEYPTFITPPPITPVKWHEFTATALTTDSWCTANSVRAPFGSAAECAAWWFNRMAPGYEHIGLDMTSERTMCLWWLY